MLSATLRKIVALRSPAANRFASNRGIARRSMRWRWRLRRAKPKGWPAKLDATWLAARKTSSTATFTTAHPSLTMPPPYMSPRRDPAPRTSPCAAWHDGVARRQVDGLRARRVTYFPRRALSAACRDAGRKRRKRGWQRAPASFKPLRPRRKFAPAVAPNSRESASTRLAEAQTPSPMAFSDWRAMRCPTSRSVGHKGRNALVSAGPNS